MEIELPNGTVLDAPDGLTPVQIKALVQNYQTKNAPPVDPQREAGNARLRELMGPLESDEAMTRGRDDIREVPNTAFDQARGALGNYVDIPMLGGADEALAGIHALFGDDFQTELSRLEQQRRDYNAVNKAQGESATAAGFVGNPLNLVGGEFVAAGRTAPLRAARGAVAGGTAAGVSGGLSTEGGLKERGLGAAAGTGVGLLAGGAVQPISELLGFGARKAGETGLYGLNFIRNQVNARKDPQGQADKLIARALMDDNAPVGFGPAPVNAPLPGQGTVNLGGQNMTALGRQATVAPGPARTKAADFFEEQTGAQSDRAADALRKLSDKGYYGTVEALDTAKKTNAAPLYKEAYGSNQNIASPAIDRILATPAGKQALNEAATMMQNDRSLMGVPDSELTALVNELVSLGKMDAPNTGKGVASGLKLRSLDYVKRALDDQYEALVRAGQKTKAGIILDLKKSLVSELDKADTTGKYAQARAAWAGPSHAVEQVDLGREFYKAKGDPAEAIRKFAGMTPEDKELVRIGFVRDAISDAGNVTDGGSVYNRLYGTPNKRALFEVMFPDRKSFEAFTQQMIAEKKMTATGRAVMGGSPTSRIDAEKASFEGASNALGFLDALKSANPLRIVGQALQTGKNMQRGVTPEVADALASRLFTSDPIQIQRVLSQVGLQKRPAPVASLRRGLLRNTPAVPLVGQSMGLLSGQAYSRQP